MTAVTGLARSFWEFALARVGVGIGEAGCSPPAHSLISGYFPPERRATALSIYSLGIPIGGAIGLGLGPQAVGILSDLLYGEFGVESLRYAMLSTVVIFAAWSVVHYALAARTLPADLRAKETLML